MKALSYRGTGLVTASLLLTGVSTLAPASVRAVGNDQCSFGGNLLAPTCTNFVFDEQGDKTLSFLQLPTAGSGTITFNQPNPPVPVWVVNVEFINDIIPSTSGLPGVFEYDLTIDPTNSFYFEEGAIDIIGPSAGLQAFTGSMTATDLPLSPLLVNNVTRSKKDLFNYETKATRVMNTYNVTTGSLNAVQNSFSQIIIDPTPKEEVPGPLPLLGAGAALGFSRRLRNRVLAARRG